MKFRLGRLVATPGAIDFCIEHRINMLEVIFRHHRGDWGDLEQEDKDANERALLEGSRILSAYTFPQGKLWIITESDRSATTILLPQEY